MTYTPTPEAIEAAARAMVGESVQRMTSHAYELATAALSAAAPFIAAQAKAEALPPAGFIVVDIKTRELDWDGTLHPTKEAAIDSLTNPRQSYCRTPDEETDERTFYGAVYEILPVVEGNDS